MEENEEKNELINNEEEKKEVEKQKENVKRINNIVRKNMGKSSLLKAIGPILIKIGIILIIIMLILGIAMFIVSMPGMAMETLKKFARTIGNEIASFFGSDKTELAVTDEQVYSTLDHLVAMGYDLKGDGFLTDYVDKKDGMLTDSKDDGVKLDKDKKIIEAESDFITTYLVSDNYTYTIANYNKVIKSGEEGKGFWGALKSIGDSGKAVWFRIRDLFTNDGYKWGRGLINIYYDENHEVGEIGDYFGDNFADAVLKTNQVKINTKENPPTLEIRKGWFSNTMKYSLDGWTGRYGMPIDFLISVHLATLMPDLAYDMVKSFDTQILILFHKLDGSAVAAYKTPKGYFTYEQMKEIVGREFWGLGFSNEEAKKIMVELGIESPDNCLGVADPIIDTTEPGNGGSNSVNNGYNGLEIYNEFIDNLNKYGNSDLSKYNSLSDLYGIIKEGEPHGIDELDRNEIEGTEYFTYSFEETIDLNTTIQNYLVKEVQDYYTTSKTYIWEADSKDGSKATYSGTINFSYIKFSGFNIGSSNVGLGGYVYNIYSKDDLDRAYNSCNDIEFCFATYKITRGASEKEIEANGGRLPKCSSTDDPKCCDVCKEYVYNKIFKVLQKADDKRFSTYQPYIAYVTNHWFRDIYFVDADGVDFVTYDDDYEALMKERWTLYETYLDENADNYGEFKLYKEDGTLFDGTEEDAKNQNVIVFKKAVTLSNVAQNDGKSRDELLEDIGWVKNSKNTWSAYEEKEGSTSTDYEKIISESDPDSVPDEAYVKLTTNYNVVQKGDGLRTVTNSRIKNMFLKNKYFRYSGDVETAEIITALRKQIDTSGSLKYYGPIEGDRKSGDSYESVDYTNTKVTLNGKTYKAKDYISKVSLEQDSLNAFSMLENTHTLDSEYIYRDFKELIVELGYFTKEELTDETPRLLQWLIPETGSYGYPYRELDKNENEYGTMIHSEGDINYTKEKLVKELLAELPKDPELKAKQATNTNPASKISLTQVGSASAEVSDGELEFSEVSVDEFLEKADELMTYMVENNYRYYTHSGGGGIGGLTAEWEESKSTKTTCCATYVSHVLQECKVMSGHTDEPEGFFDWILEIEGVEIISNFEDLEPGDILFYADNGLGWTSEASMDNGEAHVDIFYSWDDSPGGGFTKYSAGHCLGDSCGRCGGGGKDHRDGWSSSSHSTFFAIRLPFSGSKKNKGELYTGYKGNEAVVSPVTGILLEYGTYKNEKDSITNEEYRTNVDYKYDVAIPEGGSIDKVPVDKVGYAKILLLDKDIYAKFEKEFENEIQSLPELNGNTYGNSSLLTENGTFIEELSSVDQMKPNAKTASDPDNYRGWSDKQKLLYAYKEFAENYEKAGIGGYIVYIDGFVCEYPEETENEKTDFIPNENTDENDIKFDDFKVINKDSFAEDGNIQDKDKVLQSLYEKDEEYKTINKSSTDKLNAEVSVKDASVSSYYTENNIELKLNKQMDSTVSYEGVFIKEGTVIGRTMTDKELLDGNIRNDSNETYDEVRNSEENNHVIGNYIRMMILGEDYDNVENVEDYIKLDDGEVDDTEIDDFLLFYWGPYEAGGWDQPKHGPEQAQDHHVNSEVSTGICQWTDDATTNKEIYKLIAYAKEYDPRYSGMDSLIPHLDGLHSGSESPSSVVAEIQKVISGYCSEDRDAYLKMQVEAAKYEWVDAESGDAQIDESVYEMGNRMYELYPWIKDRPDVVQGTVLSYLIRWGNNVQSVQSRMGGQNFDDSWTDEQILSEETMNCFFNEGSPTRAQLQGELARAILNGEISDDEVEDWVRNCTVKEGYHYGG